MEKHRVEPQRHNGIKWISCAPHQARAWAVLKGPKLIARYQQKRQAEQVAASEDKRDLGPRRRYALGKRMSPQLRSPMGLPMGLGDASLADDDHFLRSI